MSNVDVNEALTAIRSLTPATRSMIDMAVAVQGSQRRANLGMGAGSAHVEGAAANAREAFSEMMGTAQALNALLVLRTLVQIVPRLAEQLAAATARAGRVREVAQQLDDQAGELYGQRDDVTADIVREIAHQIRQALNTAHPEAARG